MSTGHRTSAKQFGRVGASLLLVLYTGACSSLRSNVVDDPNLASLDASHTESGEAVSAPGEGEFAIAVRTERQSARCDAALQRSLEVAPELLALANWPLDSTMPAECIGGDDLPPVVAESGIADTIAGDDMNKRSPPGERAEATSNGIEAAPTTDGSPLRGQLVALGAESLDDIRGGFELADTNLKFSFGIERAVFINGQLVASSVLNLKDLQWVAGGGSAPQVAVSNGAAAGAVSVIQNGAGNGFAAQVGANLAGTVIQNTLNNQKIQNVTTINAAVNSASVLRAMSVQSAVQQGIVSSLRR